MANTGFKGIDCRQTGTALIFDGFLQDSSGNDVTSGTTSLYIYEVQHDGTLKSYDFSDNTFKAGAVTTETASLAHQRGNNSGTNTGYWTYALATLTGFTVGGLYLYKVRNTSASPPSQMRKFVYGSAEGDLLVTAGGSAGQAYLQSDAQYVKGSASQGAAGYVGLDWSKVASPTSAVNLSSTTISTSQAVASVSGAVASVTAPVTAGTVSDKTGYKIASDGLDAVSTAAPSGPAGNFREMMVQVWRRYFKKTTKSTTGNTIQTFADNGTTVITTQTWTDDNSGNQTMSAAS